jgi:excisionase family DNA binding protein
MFEQNPTTYGDYMVKADWDKAVQGPRASDHLTPVAYTIKDAIKITGMNRTRLYAELKNGSLTAKKVGRTTLISRESIEAWFENLQEYPVAQKNLTSLQKNPA